MVAIIINQKGELDNEFTIHGVKEVLYEVELGTSPTLSNDFELIGSTNDEEGGEALNVYKVNGYNNFYLSNPIYVGGGRLYSYIGSDKDLTDRKIKNFGFFDTTHLSLNDDKVKEKLDSVYKERETL